MNTKYLKRVCPGCRSDVLGPAEVKTPLKAEDTSIDYLTPIWNGFFKEKSIFSYMRCPNCGLLYTPTYFTDEQLASLYAQMPPNMDEVPISALRATQRGYFDVLKKHARLDGGYLEVGPDIGLFTENCVREGQFTDYWLLEPNRAVADALAAVVHEKPHHIIHDMFGFDQVPEGTVSAAVMVHVLDHLNDPVAVLARLRHTLRADGTLVIVTHDESSLLRRLTGSRWPAFCLQHPQLFNPASIRKMLDAAGFEVLEVRKTVNYFELRFLLKHLLWALGLKVSSLPSFGGLILGLKLGNMLTVARLRRDA